MAHNNINDNEIHSSMAHYLRDPSKISVFHLNIRSFNRNSDELSIYLSQFPAKPSIIVLSETWFSDGSVSELDGYRGHHVYRRDRRGGGVSVFMRVDIVCSAVDRFSYIDNNMEICTVNVGACGRNLTVIGIYRPPDRDIQLFTAELNAILSGFEQRNSVVVVGDINIDLLGPDIVGNDFIDMCTANSFLPLITDATHISRYGSSCIDHIWYNQLDVTYSGVDRVDISDHFAVYAVFTSSSNQQEFVTKQFRDHGDVSLRLMREQVRLFADRYRVSDMDNVNVKSAEFVDGLYKIYNEYCPIRSKCVSLNRMQKPWISARLMRCVNRKHALFREYRMGLISFHSYNTFKNITTSLIRKAKSEYYVSKFDLLRGDAKATWNLLGSLSNRRSKGHRVTQLSYRGQTVSDPQSIANSFNDFFSNIGQDLDREIPDVPISPLDYMGNPSPSSFFIRPASVAEVVNLINKLPNKTSNIYSVPTFIWKFCNDLISPIICTLFNSSINAGIFPECLKIARVVPVFKAGNKLSVNNYRPISVLPTLSKIFEKLMFNRLSTFVNNNNIINSNQFGFRLNSCTSDAVLEFLDHTFNSLSNNQALLSVFLDFSKAFDTVNHNILLGKLSRLGIRGVASDWFSSYLRNRQQYVVIGDSSSAVAEVNIGVPQGSVLGPILFLIYINDMSNCSPRLKYVHFADDTTAFHSADNVEQLMLEVNGDLDMLFTWLQCNRLSLNISKTVYMLFTDKNILRPPDIKIAGSSINRVAESKFLGITIDSRLTFTTHISSVCRHVSKSIGLMNRLSALLPSHTKTNIYYSLIYSRVNYGIVAWGAGSINSTRKLANLLLKAHRIVNYQSYPHSTDGPVELLTFGSVYQYFTAMKLYKTLRLDYHPHFSDLYRRLLPTHDYRTRFNNELHFNIPFYSKIKCNRSFLYQSISTWNSLPDDIKRCSTLLSFKSQLRDWLLSNQR